MKILSLLLAVVMVYTPAWAEAKGINDAKIDAYFAPGDACTNAIVKVIDDAKSSVRVLAYHLTAPTIAKAIAEAQKRGLSVEVILDRSQSTKNYSSADFLLHADVSVRIDNAHAIAHNKVIVIDDRISSVGLRLSIACPLKNSTHFSAKVETSVLRSKSGYPSRMTFPAQNRMLPCCFRGRI